MKTKPKILIFSTSFFPLIGGDVVAVKQITRNLDQDFDFVVFTARLNRKFKKQEEMGNILVHRFGFGFWFDKYLLAFFGSYFADRLYKEKDVALVWSLLASFAGLAVENYKKRHPRVPFLLTIQEGDDPVYIKKKMRFLKWRFNNIFRRADYIQTISNFLADWARSFKPVAPIQVIPNGIDLEKFQYKPKDIEYGKENIIVSASRLVPKNGLEDLIKALALTKNKFKLLIAGEGYLEKNLKELVENLDLSDQVYFWGRIDYDEVPAFLSQGQIFCRPSLSEGLGNSFLEAMAVGNVVVATPVGGIVDFLYTERSRSVDNESGRSVYTESGRSVDAESSQTVNQKQNGFFSEPKNPEDLAKKLDHIVDLKNKKEIDGIRINARKTVEKDYDPKVLAQKFKKIFNKLIDGKS